MTLPSGALPWPKLNHLKRGERLDEDEIDFVRKQINKIDAVEVSEASIADWSVITAGCLRLRSW